VGGGDEVVEYCGMCFEIHIQTNQISRLDTRSSRFRIQFRQSIPVYDVLTTYPIQYDIDITARVDDGCFAA